MLLYAGLLFSMFLDYVRPGSYLPIINALKFNSLIPLMVLVATVFYEGSTNNQRVFNHKNTKLLLIFMVLLGISVLTADVTFYSYTIFLNVLGFVFWYYMIARLITSHEKIVGLFIVFIVSHLIVLLLNPQVVLNPETRSYIEGNPYLGDGNDFALSVVGIAIPMCIYMVMISKKLVAKVSFSLALIGLIFAVVGTQSRGATIALAFVFLYLWWVGRQKILGIMLIGALLAVVVSYAPPVYFQRLNSVANYENEGSAQGRIIAWKTAIRMVKKYPLTGVGTGHFAVKLGTEFRPPEYGTLQLPWLTAHSLYFLIIGELGIPGIACLLILFAGNFFRNTKLSNEARGSPDPKIQEYRELFIILNASLIAFAVGGAFLSVAYYPHLYVLIGIYTAANCIYENANSDVTPHENDAQPEWHENDPARATWNGDDTQTSNRY